MKKIFPLFLAVCLIVCCFSVSAAAATVTQDTPSGEFNVYYSLHGQYAINIPSSLMLSQNNTATISADYLHLDKNESVKVTMDDSTFSDNGNFELTAYADQSKMKCIILASTPAVSEPFELTRETNADPLITYTSDNADAIATLQFVPKPEKASVSGAYEGKVIFNFALVVQSNDKG